MSDFKKEKMQALSEDDLDLVSGGVEVGREVLVQAGETITTDLLENIQRKTNLSLPYITNVLSNYTQNAVVTQTLHKNDFP